MSDAELQRALGSPYAGMPTRLWLRSTGGIADDDFGITQPGLACFYSSMPDVFAPAISLSLQRAVGFGLSLANELAIRSGLVRATLVIRRVRAKPLLRLEA